MKKTTALVLALLMCLPMLFGCLSGRNGNAAASDGQTDDSSLNSGSAPIGEEIKIIDSSIDMTDFDKKLIAFVGEKFEGKNYMVSPLSFRYALGLLVPGAAGETKAELMTALGVSDEAELEKVCTIFNGVSEKYNASVEAERKRFEERKEKGYLSEDAVFPERGLNIANSVWKREDIEADFKDGYKEKINKIYSSEYKYFNSGNVIGNVNSWANEKTRGLIPELLPEDYSVKDLAIILMNAIYFKNEWEEEFEKYATQENDFTTSGGEKVKKDFMTRTSKFLYYGDEETQLVILPMKDGIYMTFVIGDTSDLAKKTSMAQSTAVKVTIPKFDVETSFNNQELIEFLKANGVNLAFGGKADFSDMIDCSVCVDDIIQKTRIKLDENGVEAAAVTEISMTKGCAETQYEKYVEFTADKPFSFFIYTTADSVTEMMFAGQIAE